LTTPGDWGWGETYTFYVNATDEDLDQLITRAYYRQLSPTQGAWTEVSSTNASTGLNQTVSFSRNFNFPNIGNLTFKFNTTDDEDDPVAGGNQYSDEILGAKWVDLSELHTVLPKAYGNTLTRGIIELLSDF